MHWHEKIPAPALDYVQHLTKGADVDVRLSRPRKSKWGDFRARRGRLRTEITVNVDLDPYHFLIVFIHEWAHYITWKKYQFSVAPHGVEWKRNYAALLQPLVDSSIFPEELKVALQGTIANPAAASCRDLHLMRVLKAMRPKAEGAIAVEQLKLGERFAYQNRRFKLVKKARSRYHCEEESSKRIFAFHALAEVVRVSV